MPWMHRQTFIYHQWYYSHRRWRWCTLTRLLNKKCPAKRTKSKGIHKGINCSTSHKLTIIMLFCCTLLDFFTSSAFFRLVIIFILLKGSVRLWKWAQLSNSGVKRSRRQFMNNSLFSLCIFLTCMAGAPSEIDSSREKMYPHLAFDRNSFGFWCDCLKTSVKSWEYNSAMNVLRNI